MNWDKIRVEWETTDITLKNLAAKHDIKLGTLKSRKSREGWSRDATKKDATKGKKVAISKKKKQNPLPKENEPVVESEELTEKQQLFCLYYVKSFNQTMAAIKAGYAPESAHVQGSRLLRNDKVVKEIRKLKGELQQEIFIDAKDVLNKYIQIAFADISDYATFGKREVVVMGPTGPLKDKKGKPVTREVNYVDFNESTLVDGTIITEVKQGKDGISVKLADKMKAMEMLSKYHDLLSENDKRRLEEEKLRAEIAKSKNEDENSSIDDWIAAMGEVDE